MLTIFAAFLLQAALIGWLIYEHRRRHLAEVSARHAMAELTHMNRVATAGELSASIAHEINQPLTGIVTRASAARRWLARENPDIDKARAAWIQLRLLATGQARSSKTSRSMFRKDTAEKSAGRYQQVDLDRLGISLHRFAETSRSIFKSELDDQIPPVLGNQVQLQQVILNLIMNAVDSMRSVQPRVLSINPD